MPMRKCDITRLMSRAKRLEEKDAALVSALPNRFVLMDAQQRWGYAPTTARTLLHNLSAAQLVEWHHGPPGHGYWTKTRAGRLASEI